MKPGLHAAVGRLAVRRAAAAGAGARLSADRVGQRHARSAASCAATSSSPSGKPIIRSPIAITSPTPSLDPSSPDNVMTVRDSVEGPRRIVPRNQWGFARAEGSDGRRSDARLHGGEVRAGQDLRGGLHGARTRRSSGSGRPRSATSISMLKYKSADALVDSRRRDQPRAGVRHLAERPLPSHLPVLRVQPQTRTTARCSTASSRRSPAPAAAASTTGSRSRRATATRIINFFYPTDIFPFTDVAQKDPETGVTDGLLTHAGSPELLPKIFYTNSEYEVPGAAPRRSFTRRSTARRRAADGQRPDLPARRRAARPGAFPPAQTIGQQRNNPLDYRWAMKALLLAMDRWTATARRRRRAVIRASATARWCRRSGCVSRRCRA